MCVIIHRQPGVDIDHDKLRSACIVNPDGMGISIIDRGKIETVHIFEKNVNNNADQLIKLFEDAKEHMIFAHLRFTTKGEKIKENVHPFLIHKNGDYEIWFMHNGTLYNYEDKENPSKSDSRVFAETFLSPLTKTFGLDKDLHPFNSSLYKEIIDKYRGGSSVFCIYDSLGNSIKFGDGKKFEGWWASNDYSFNRLHRVKDDKKSTWSDSGYYGGMFGGSRYGASSYTNNNQYDSWDDAHEDLKNTTFVTNNGSTRERHTYHGDNTKTVKDLNSGKSWTVDLKTGKLIGNVRDGEAEKKEPGKSLVVAPPATTGGSTNQKQGKVSGDKAHLGFAIARTRARIKNGKTMDHTPPMQRLTFCDLADIPSLDLAMNLDEQEIHEVVTDMPVVATALIMDLLYTLYNKRKSEIKEMDVAEKLKENLADKVSVH